MDKLKSYLTDNSNFLGDDVPSKNVWSNVSSQFVNSKPAIIDKKFISVKIITILKYSIAACVMVLAGIGIKHLAQPKLQNTIEFATDKKINSGDSDFVTTQIADTPFAILHNIGNTIVDEIFSDTNTQQAPNITAFNSHESGENSVGFRQVKNVDSQFSQVINIQKNRINNTPLFAEKPPYFKEFVVELKQMEQDEKKIKKDIIAMGVTNQLLEQLINVYQQKLNLLKLLQTEINKTNIRFKQNRYLIDTAKAYFIQI